MVPPIPSVETITVAETIEEESSQRPSNDETMTVANVIEEKSQHPSKDRNDSTRGGMRFKISLDIIIVNEVVSKDGCIYGKEESKQKCEHNSFYL